jgi:hypothetical protein
MSQSTITFVVLAAVVAVSARPGATGAGDVCGA